MKGFYPRLLEGQGNGLKRQAKYANRLVADALGRLESEFYQREITVDFRVQEQPHVMANLEAAQALVEIVLIRALAVSEQGSRLGLRWEGDESPLTLEIALQSPPHSSRGKAVAPLIQLVPLSLTWLDLAGLSFTSESPAGPWRIGLAGA
jgi:hypothetical protein